MRLHILVGVAALAAGCPKPRDLRSPWDRPVTNTAYTVRGVQAEVSVGGSQTPDLGARVGITAGLGPRAQVDVNVGHLALGVANGGVRGTLVEQGSWALALDARVLTTSPRLMWYLPSELRNDLGGIGLLTLPVGLYSSQRFGRHLVASLGVGYEHSAVGGSFSNEALVFDGSIGARRLWARPSVHLAIGRLVLEGTLFVPYAVWGVTALDATADLQPGVRAGATSYEWARLPAGLGNTWQLVGELRWGPARVRAGVTGSPVASEVGIPFVPMLGVRVRTGPPREEAP